MVEFLLAVSKTTDGHLAERQIEAKHIIGALALRPNTAIVELDERYWEEWDEIANKRQYATNRKTQDDHIMCVALMNNVELVSIDKQMFEHPDCSAGRAEVASPFRLYEELRMSKGEAP